MAVATQSGGGSYLTRSPNPSGLYDVVDLILDKGLVIDVYVRVSLIGIEILTIDARIVVASVDTYLRFAEAVGRLDLEARGGKDVGEVLGELREGGAKTKAKGAISGATESIKETFTGEDENEDEEEQREGQPAPRRKRSREASDK